MNLVQFVNTDGIASAPNSIPFFFKPRHITPKSANTILVHSIAKSVKKNLEGWNIKGMSSQVYPGYAFSIDADLEMADSHMVLTFDVRKFFPQSGDAYWLAVPENKYRFDRLHNLTDHLRLLWC